MTKRETIIQALLLKLQTISGITVYREAVGAVAREAGAVVLLRPVSDSAGSRQNTQQDHVLGLLVSIGTRGTTAAATADAICESVHVKMTEDQNVGGAINVMFQRTQFAVEEADGGGASLIQTLYEIGYRADYRSLN